MEMVDIDVVYKSDIKNEGFAVSEESRFYSKNNLTNWVKNGDDILLIVEEDGEINCINLLFRK